MKVALITMKHIFITPRPVSSRFSHFHHGNFWGNLGTKSEPCDESDETYCLIGLGRGSQVLSSVEAFVSSRPSTNQNISIVGHKPLKNTTTYVSSCLHKVLWFRHRCFLRLALDPKTFHQPTSQQYTDLDARIYKAFRRRSAASRRQKRYLVAKIIFSRTRITCSNASYRIS